MSQIKFGSGLDQQIIAWSQGVRDRYFGAVVDLLVRLHVRPVVLTVLGVLAMLAAGFYFKNFKVLSFLLFGVALLMDGLDGPLARRLKVDGFWGEVFDALADTLGFWFLVLGMVVSNFVDPMWAAIYIVNYALMQFLIFYHLNHERKIVVPWRSRFFVFIIYGWWLMTGMFLFDVTFVVFGIYMLSENFKLLIQLKWKF